MNADKLVMMINQIASFHRRLPADRAAAEIATHLRRYWEPRMRTDIESHLQSGGAGLEPNARAAVALLRERAGV